jgi:hypothetical protein
MTHRESLCDANIVVLVAPTQTKAVVSCDPVFESGTKDGELIEHGAHETVTIA